jgi:hypothetical protein
MAAKKTAAKTKKSASPKPARAGALRGAALVERAIPNIEGDGGLDAEVI